MNDKRRRLLIGGGVLFATPVTLFAQQCRGTPRDALGPFYVTGAPAQADLCASGPAVGQKLTVSGRVLGMPACAPLAGALVEVWQADARGDYTQVTAGKKDDPGCLLRASVTTDGSGRYRFQTLVPGEYPGRPRHIHYRVSAAGHAALVTQLYFSSERGVPGELVAKAAQKDGALTANFDITLAKQ